ncbi:MAG: DUF4349 domain-containing protein [Bacteroidales bacterium]|nr:DUF4349 domain-containing protein [Bacteroidales bacterium]
MKKITCFLLISTFLFVIVSCSQKEEIKEMGHADIVTETETSDIKYNSSSSDSDASQQQDVTEKKIIKDGEIIVTVKQLEKSKLRIDSLLKKYNGYYAREKLNNTDWSSSYSLQIRVPGSNFEKLVKDIEAGEGKIDHKALETRDVTEQYVDLETRLDNKRSYLERYKEILKQAKSIKEILEVEEIIRKMEEEIESTTGRIRYLKDQVAYSSLDLTITTEKDYKYLPDKRPGFFERLKQSLSNGWFGFVDFLLVILKIWPFWIIIGLGIYFWRRWRNEKE